MGFKQAALKAANHYAQRHISMEEPYWGGTLDAQGEDKEGVWAAFQGFLAVYELTKEQKYLHWARHACDISQCSSPVRRDGSGAVAPYSSYDYLHSAKYSSDELFQNFTRCKRRKGE